MPRYFLLFTLLFTISGASAQSLRVGVWEGAHELVTQQLLLEPFSRTKGIKVTGVSSAPASLPGNGLDVVQMELRDSIDACDRGDISLLPLQTLPLTFGQALVEEYVPDALQPCSIGQFLWSSLPVYNRSNRHFKQVPTLIGDFFNTVDFPGKRAMVKSPRNLAEWALAATGVDRASIYQELARDRAWLLIESKLSDIESDIIWVRDDAEALALLESGDAAFAVVQSNSALRKMVEQKTDLGLIWDAAITHINVFAIPATTQQFVGAWKFLQFATSAEVSGQFAARFGFGSARYSALPAFSPPVRRALPTYQANRDNQIAGDSGWWRESGARLNQQFVLWLTERNQYRTEQLVTEWRPMQDITVSQRAAVTNEHTGTGTN